MFNTYRYNWSGVSEECHPYNRLTVDKYNNFHNFGEKFVKHLLSILLLDKKSRFQVHITYCFIVCLFLPWISKQWRSRLPDGVDVWCSRWDWRRYWNTATSSLASCSLSRCCSRSLPTDRSDTYATDSTCSTASSSCSGLCSHLSITGSPMSLVFQTTVVLICGPA